MTAKVESYCLQNKRVHTITVDTAERACINCIWYEQHFRKSRTNIAGWIPTCTGYCILHDEQRGPLRQPCKKFEAKEKAPSSWPTPDRAQT